MENSEHKLMNKYASLETQLCLDFSLENETMF